MNIAKKIRKNFCDFFLSPSFFITKKAVATLSLLFAITVISYFVVYNYCDIFFNFSEEAKNRILFQPNLVYFTTPFLFWVSSFLHKKYAFNPYGSGLDNITLALKKLEKDPNNYQKISNFIGLRIAVVTIISSLISTFAGGSLGREAPSILIVVCICFALAHYLRNFIIKLSLEVWVYVGYAVGITVAFNAPWAGVVYMLEKIIKNRHKHYIKSIILALIAILISCILLRNHGVVYYITNFNKLEPVDWHHYLVIAIFCSILSFLMLKITKYFYIKFITIKGIKWHFIPLIFGLIVALIGLNFGIFAVGGGIRSVNEALISESPIYTKNEFIGRYSSTIFTHMSGNIGGLVAPSIALGNVVGNIYASLFTNLDAKALMLVGMVAFLSPVLSAPITSAIVIVESTKIGFENSYILILASLLSFSLMLIFQKIGSKIRAKLYQPKSN